MKINDISSNPFCCYCNGNVYKMNWLEPLKIKSKCPVDVGIDQSSTSTGICIQGEGLLFLTELPRENMSLLTYKKALKRELDCLLRNFTLNHFIYEKHKFITPLVSTINEITYILKSYTKQMDKHEVKVKSISPPVWRKGFFKNSDYTGSFNRNEIKAGCVDLVIKEKPETEIFKKFSHKDYDAYEAYGIINGYLNLNYAEDGTRIVNTSMQYISNREFSYIIEKCSKYEKEDKIDEMRIKYGTIDTPIVLGNKELLLEDSLNRIVGEYVDAILVIQEHSEIPRYILETNEHYNAGDIYLVYVRK